MIHGELIFCYATSSAPVAACCLPANTSILALEFLCIYRSKKKKKRNESSLSPDGHKRSVYYLRRFFKFVHLFLLSAAFLFIGCTAN